MRHGRAIRRAGRGRCRGHHERRSRPADKAEGDRRTWRQRHARASPAPPCRAGSAARASAPASSPRICGTSRRGERGGSPRSGRECTPAPRSRSRRPSSAHGRHKLCTRRPAHARRRGAAARAAAGGASSCWPVPTPLARSRPEPAAARGAAAPALRSRPSPPPPPPAPARAARSHDRSARSSNRASPGAAWRAAPSASRWSARRRRARSWQRSARRRSRATAASARQCRREADRA